MTQYLGFSLAALLVALYLLLTAIYAINGNGWLAAINGVCAGLWTGTAWLKWVMLHD